MTVDVSQVSLEMGGSSIEFETGKLARQASGSVVVTAGETKVLCTATAGNPRDVDFLPLTVDVEERMYAAGKIPGSFFRREGRAGEKATLTARMIDRPLRPLFPKGWNRETQLVSIPMSIDHMHPYDVLAMNGASAALMVSDIPFPAPVGAVRIGQDGEGNFLVNPDEEWLLESPLDLVVAGTEEAILMVEAGANEITEAEILDALDIAHAEIKRLCEAQHELRRKAGKDKIELTPPQVDESILSEISSRFGDALDAATQVPDKLERQDATKAVEEEVLEALGTEVEVDEDGVIARRAEVQRAFDKLEKDIIRRRIAVDKKRPDGRAAEEIRDIWIEVPACSPRCTAPRSSPAARRRRSRSPRSARPATRSASTRSACRRPSATSTTTTSRRSRWARPASCAAPGAATSVTAPSPSARWCRCVPKIGRVPVHDPRRVGHPRVERLDARWPRSAAGRCR